MSDANETRRLAPDTKWILAAMFAAFGAVVGITQYQIDRAAELVLERARGGAVTADQMNQAFRPRDEKIRSLEMDVTTLREERAKVTQSLTNINTTLSRIVDVSIQTTNRAAQLEGQLKQLLKQTESNAKIAANIVDRYQTSFQSFSERLTRMEATQTAPDTIR